jgi:acetylglutamate kinase
MEALIDKAGVLIEALPYIQKFREAVVVIKFGGSAMEDPELIRGTMRDIVFMECVGMKPVVVHGGGKAISARLKEMGIGTEFINGLRYTCEKTVAVVDDVLHNEVNAELLSAITAAGGRGSQVSGKKFLTAERMTTRCTKTGADLDIGLVGEIAGVDTSHIHAALAEGVVPVIPPLGVGVDGRVYNINADIAACRIAEALHARKLVFLSDVPGILRDPKDESTLISHINLGEVDGLIQQGVISGGMVPKIRSAESALRSGTNKVHMIDGRVKHSLLLEIFTDRGIGTEIVRE